MVLPIVPKNRTGKMKITHTVLRVSEGLKLCELEGK